MDVPDTSVAVELPNEAVVLISYDVSVSRIKASREQIASGEESEVGFRVAVDGSPYRESATTVGDREPLVTTASGYLVLELPSGHHDVKLQWRKRGHGISMWVISSELLDGFVGGRSLVVSAQQRFIWYAQPLTSASLVSIDTWESVPDMALHFRLSETASLRIFYQLPARPELVNYERGRWIVPALVCSHGRLWINMPCRVTQNEQKVLRVMKLRQFWKSTGFGSEKQGRTAYWKAVRNRPSTFKAV